VVYLRIDYYYYHYYVGNRFYTLVDRQQEMPQGHTHRGSQQAWRWLYVALLLRCGFVEQG
jgi:hypothetical protein